MNKGPRSAPNGYAKGAVMPRRLRPIITHERLLEVMRYDPETGKWLALISRRRTRAGSETGTINALGYVQICIDGRIYLSHALAWFYMTGRWPHPEVDHENLIKHDNRWNNLREATRSRNEANKPAPSHNTSGIKGVSWHSQAGKWRAALVVNQRQLHLGLFTSKEDAAAAYLAAARQHFGEFARAA